MALDWYKICEADDQSLEQGDFVLDCPIVIPPEELNEEEIVDIDVQKIDSIVLSQSCDLQHGKINNVLVCPFYPLSYWLTSLLGEDASKKAKKKEVDKLRKGHFPAYHLLNQDHENNFLEDYQVVDFRNVYGVHFDVLKSIITEDDSRNRLRLLPPYKEHLSQAFARYFMRVGLPNDLSIENSYFERSVSD